MRAALRQCGHFRMLAATVLFIFLSACSAAKPWHLNNVSGLLPPLAFTMTSDTGQVVTADQYRGKVVLLYFGFTHCTDECPDTMAKLAGMLKAMGPQADHVQVLFVSVDPARDTPQVLKVFTAAFDPHITGLRGSQDALTALTKRYRVSYSQEEADARGDYEVTHSNALFIFDAQGKARLIATAADSTASIRSDVQRLIDQE